MELRTVHIQAPVKVWSCHLRFPGEGGADQYRRRSHQLQLVEGRKKADEFSPKNVYRLEGETMFKAGEIIETDFPFPKAMRAVARYADEDSAAEASADAA